MASYNRIVLMGNLTRDPELSYTPSNTAVCKIRLATNHKWRDREGNTREEVCFVDCTIFGKGGETFNQYMTKGRSVLLDGRLKYDQWTNAEGEKKSKHEVIVENFTFVGGGRREDSPMQSPEGGEAAQFQTAAASPSGNEPPPPTDDDIPF